MYKNFHYSFYASKEEAFKPLKDRNDFEEEIYDISRDNEHIGYFYGTFKKLIDEISKDSRLLAKARERYTDLNLKKTDEENQSDIELLDCKKKYYEKKIKDISEAIYGYSTVLKDMAKLDIKKEHYVIINYK